VHELFNLVADLSAERFGAAACAAARERAEAEGFRFETPPAGDGAFFAWIDDTFGGSWSSEAFVSKNAAARANDGNYAGFASYEPQGLAFSWLRGAARQTGTGVFGPFGVVPRHRGTALGPALLVQALGALLQAGYTRALIPAVGSEKLVRYYERHAGARIAERFDAAHWSAKRYRTVVLASGNGSNFQAAIDAVERGDLPLDLALLLSNNPSAYALQRAHGAGIAHSALAWDRASEPRAHYDRALLDAVLREEPELVLLLGWMHVLDDAFVNAFPETINIHPAFLPLDQSRDDVVFPDGTVTPAFRGARAVRDALRAGASWVGASCHRVTLAADRGPVLTRTPMRVAEGEDEPAVMARLHPREHAILTDAIRRWVYER